MYLPKSYNFYDLEDYGELASFNMGNPSKWDLGPLWTEICLGIYGQCGVIVTGTQLAPMDLVDYDGTLYIVPASEMIGKSVVVYEYKTVAKLIDREKWFEINNEAYRMKRTFIPNGISTALAL